MIINLVKTFHHIVVKSVLPTRALPSQVYNSQVTTNIKTSQPQDKNRFWCDRYFDSNEKNKNLSAEKLIAIN